MPILTPDSEYELASLYRDKQDTKAASRLVEHHLRMVLKIARGYSGYGIPLSDLVAQGNLGILQALKNFDPDKGFRFSTYAMWWVKASLKDYVLKTWSLVKTGGTAAHKKLFFNIRKEHQELLKEDGRGDGLSKIHVEKLAKKFNVKEYEIIEMYQRMVARDQSLNALINNEDQQEWIDWVEDERDNPEQVVLHNDEAKKRRILLEKAMECLTKQEFDIFKARRLIEPTQTLEELSNVNGLSKERIRQIEWRAFEKVQKRIKSLVDAERYDQNNKLHKII
jgi:RNA polymerase sigma-32 factor